ncbi:MAG: DUF3732 domain-containing protein [Kangiellaceae bacterium]|nr:DUF3732 domain-containing protein [Kangiellaceae bacterium]
MKFQLKKLVIWPRSVEFAPRIVEFEVGKVNVITGGSRTGKSAIIPIIDYCLASSDCNIPIDTIRDHASWYGVVFQTESEEILICRCVPEGNKASNEFYLLRGEAISVPPVINAPNEKTDGVKNILNSISSVPYFSLSGDEDSNKAFQARLGFRDLMALVFQSQDLVANQNIIFYKTHAHEHREKLRNWFPYILGAENIDILIARQRMQVVERRLGQLRKELERARAVSNSWMSNMLGHIKVADEYGLLDEPLSENCDSEELVNVARSIIENIPDYSKTSMDNVERANNEIARLEVEDENISFDIGAAKKRLTDIRRLKSGFSGYGATVRKRVDRLHISQWLESVSVESSGCPACGSRDHPNSALEFKKISSAFKIYEEECATVSEVPTSFSREEEIIKIDLEAALEKKKVHQKRFDFLLSRDKKSQEEFQRKRSMFLFLGHLQSSMETFERLSDGGEFQNEIDALEKEHEELLRTMDSKAVRRRIEAATAIISQQILVYLKILDVEEKYRIMPPEFSVKDLNIRVRSNDGHWHFLAEVGSASNWVSFHIALMCSLHEYFLDQEASCVPGFVIFDQPSQVYFPKLQRGEESKDNSSYKDEDVDAVKSIFKTLAKSVLASKGKWQSIVLDHADAGIYGDIDGVHEVDVWRDGVKLIPTEWYAQ